ncbi:hypothetical protein HMP0015_3209 [Acinetobacter haemolyticus ATCC 19194]|uniref:Uncharacterized protein n=1 Tax=Acinetobacter haemolyticus ATCC 19194 TaxID=707232 RepID=D4XU17_ACIHA|nr:hypothetical protein HMP0015_3209 [Acinetobacter haemolyticus ATCC 19194]
MAFLLLGIKVWKIYFEFSLNLLISIENLSSLKPFYYEVIAV